MNRIRLLVLASVLGVGIPITAAAQGSGWIVDPARSRLGFSCTQTGANFAGTFKQYEAQTSLDPAHPQSGHALVVIDMASASAGGSLCIRSSD